MGVADVKEHEAKQDGCRDSDTPAAGCAFSQSVRSENVRGAEQRR